MKINAKKFLSATIATLLLATTLFSQVTLASADSTVPSSQVKISTIGVSDTIYASYIKKYKDAPTPDKQIIVELLNYKANSPDYVKVQENLGGKQGKSLQTTDDGYIEWTINVENEGLYNVGIDYYTQVGKGSAILRSFKIDGILPFDETNCLSFSRVFTNEKPIKYNDKGNVIRKFDTIGSGNELRPSQVEVPMWMSQDLSDIIGYYNAPFQFYLSKGAHTIRLESIREPMTIGNIKIYQIPKANNYAQAKQDYTANGYSNTSGQDIEIQGENAVLKSDSMIYPITDYSSPVTEPSSPNQTLLNTIGGNKWQSNQQWATWDFYAPKTGLYKMGIKARQNIESGQPSYRRLFIDGKLPFSEMNSIKILYSMQWNMIVPGTESNPDLFYLTEGKHTLKLEVTLSEFSSVLLDINNLIGEYTAVYRSILMIVGPAPDLNRDYNFTILIPDQLKKLKTLSDKTKQVYKDFINVAGLNGQQGQVMLNAAKIADEMSSRPDRIPYDFATFNTYIGALGTLLNQIQRQPVEIDYISIISPNQQFKSVDAGFIGSLSFALKQFFTSFYTDYTTIGTAKADAVKVWIGNGSTGGRDQANVLNSMISNYFTSKENINVNLQLVPMGSLLSATLAKKGPDVALTVGQSDPMNYAIRGAVIDFTQFKDYPEVAKRFTPSALTALTFDNKVYGLPETQNFPMLFYRTDIMKELNLTVPKTWDDVISMIPTLEKKNLEFGMPPPFGGGPYTMFLYQNGGQLYNDGGKSSALDTTAAVNAFYQWTRFYTDYGLPYVYDATTRFRTGEMPILIQDYGFYNLLSVAAPELNGKWNFALIPGTRQADGTINNTNVCGVSACIIMNNAKNKLDAWKFITWWTSAHIQEMFGREVESIMGPAARYQTANMEALYQIPWNTSDYKNLIQERNVTKGMPEVPGSYMTGRYLDFAVKKVIIPQAASTTDVTASVIDPGQIIIDAANLITGEIKVRRNEFGLPN
jgi:ABC-type glycerol-3-phosphate transport system substrate-binding protein